MVGSAIPIASKFEFSVVGGFFAAVTTTAGHATVLLMRRLTKGTSHGSLDVSERCAAAVACVTSALAAGHLGMGGGFAEVPPTNYALGLFALTGFFGAIIQITVLYIASCQDATTYSIIANVKTPLIMFGASLVLSEPFAWNLFAGVLLSMVGLFIYGHNKLSVGAKQVSREERRREGGEGGEAV